MWPNPQETAGLVTFTEEICNGKLHFLCNDYCYTIKTITYYLCDSRSRQLFMLPMLLSPLYASYKHPFQKQSADTFQGGFYLPMLHPNCDFHLLFFQLICGFFWRKYGTLNILWFQQRKIFKVWVTIFNQHE